MLALVQVGAIFAAPLSDCCARRAVRFTQRPADECCPAGTHAAGQCPLHARANAPNPTACHLTCGTHETTIPVPAFAAIPAGVLTFSVQMRAERFVAAETLGLSAPALLPDPPPPEPFA